MNKKIGLALSGGGINGIAHLELVKKLESEGIFPSVLAGSSAGAIIALLYADGGARAIVKFFDELDRTKIFYRRRLLTGGFGTAFKRLEELLRSMIRAKTFSELPVPFACAATDLMSGDAIILKSGDLVSAVMASSAAPGFFRPSLLGGKYLADGGISNSIPVDAINELGGSFVIGSILNNFRPITLTEAQGFSRITTLNRAVEIIRHNDHLRQVANCDFCFDFPIADIPGYSFHAKDISIKRAKDCLSEQMPKLLRILASKDQA